MWICPKCKREFRNRNQDHSCGNFPVEKVFEKYPSVIPLFEKLREIVMQLEGVKMNPVKNAVLFSRKTNFLAVKPDSAFLKIECASTTKHDEFPVEKTVKISKTRFTHLIKICSPENIDQQLTDWLKEAYISDS